MEGDSRDIAELETLEMGQEMEEDVAAMGIFPSAVDTANSRDVEVEEVEEEEMLMAQQPELISQTSQPRKRASNGNLKNMFAASAPQHRQSTSSASKTEAEAVTSAHVPLLGEASMVAAVGRSASASASASAAAPALAGSSPGHAPGAGGGVLLSAFKLSVSSVQTVLEAGLAPPLPANMRIKLEFGEQESDAERTEADHTERLETAVLTAPVPLSNLHDAVPLLEASVPLLPSGKAIFKQLPAQWLDVSGRSDALGTRCLFASRRHEHSVFEPVSPERLLQVPLAAREWQLPLSVPTDALSAGSSSADEAPWTVQLHPGIPATRVLVRPGVLLLGMLRRGTALPAARFTWRVTDSSASPEQSSSLEKRPLSTSVGEFSILSNLEDAACTQPPGFVRYPLRREQLRSLGWMLSQERRRKEPFVTELREFATCPDAPHWRLEGSLRCEYSDVKGGVLADAIGYGKTACTIGLVDSTREASLPRVPAPFTGFIPTRATLILAPTNLHGQWLAEISKFTGDSLKVLSVPTCAQLKRLSLRELAEADIVVATYRLFYSTPYLRRLEELARGKRPGFAFPKQPAGQAVGSDWSRAYRTAFEALPAWADKLRATRCGLDGDPVTPARRASAARACAEAAEKKETPEEVMPQATTGPRRRRGVLAANTPPAKSPASEGPCSGAHETLGAQVKRRRMTGKQAFSQLSQGAPSPAQDNAPESPMAWPESVANTHYVPLEAFWWRRVVCDEFHELLSRYPPAQVAVELFHADYKWGLSGTPPCQTLAQIRKAAGFLGVQLPTSETTDREEPRKVAQEWLDAFVRRNTAELPPLEEQERIVPVRQTPKERALYLALTEQQNLSQGFAGVAATEGLEMPLEIKELKEASRSASGLLKLCSHFCASGASDVLTAEDECERQLAIRREQARSSQREVHAMVERAASTAQLVQHFEPYYMQTPDASSASHICKEPKAGIVARLKFLGSSTLGAKAELLERLFAAASKRSSSVKERALQLCFDAKAAGKASQLPPDPEELGGTEPAWQRLLNQAADACDSNPDEGNQVVLQAIREALVASAPERPTRCIRLRSHLGMPRWPGTQETDSEDRQELEAANQTWLRVRANAEKLQKVIDAWKADIQRCALRLLALQSEVAEKMLSLKSFQDTLHASQLAVQPEDLEMEGVSSRFAKYGSKIETLVRHVQKIQSDDPECKSICFVQWEDLKRKVSSALEEFGVEHITLQGSVWARQTALRRFQYELDGPRMLLLSLEESASGTNLTAANHVLIVHPMEAESREEAVAFEMQAMGRVRRPGQQRKIYIWRFVTMGTIEQEITEDHQRELWERQSAKILVSSTGHGGEIESDMDVDEEPDGGLEAPEQSMDATQQYLGSEGGAAHAEAEAVVDIDMSTQCYMPTGFTEQEPCHAASSSSPSTFAKVVKGIEEDDEIVLDNKIESQTIPYWQGEENSKTLFPASAPETFAATQGYPDMDATQCYPES